MIQANIITWNVQGAGSGDFLRVLKELIRLYDPKVLALFETKISGQQAEDVCNKIGFNGQVRVEAQGFRGGVWLLWRDYNVDINIINLDERAITAEVCKLGSCPWYFTAVYGIPNDILCHQLWVKLAHFNTIFDKPWLLAGDFNDTVSRGERQGCSPQLERRCNCFNNWLHNNGFVDLGFIGPPFHLG